MQNDKVEISDEGRRKLLLEKFTNTLYAMSVGEDFDMPGYKIFRVPGGWNYLYLDSGGKVLCGIFVPWNDEAMPQWMKVANEAGFLDSDVIVPGDDD